MVCAILNLGVATWHDFLGVAGSQPPPICAGVRTQRGLACMLYDVTNRRFSMKTVAPVLIALAAVLPSSALAQANDDVFGDLISAKSLKCTFAPGTVAEWKGGEFALSKDQWKGDTHFDSIDLKQSRARLIGNATATDVLVLPTAQGLSFLEATDSGNVILTTVFAARCGPAGSFCAVMSRHVNLVGEVFPSQYYGSCVVWQ
jgi:hypothetical protein